MATGIDVNPKFDSIRSFEFTDEIAIFDLCNVSIVHGWLIDPSDTEVVNQIKNLSYNQVVCNLITLAMPTEEQQEEEEAHSKQIQNKDDLNLIVLDSPNSTKKLQDEVKIHLNIDDSKYINLDINVKNEVKLTGENKPCSSTNDEGDGNVVIMDASPGATPTATEEKLFEIKDPIDQKQLQSDNQLNSSDLIKEEGKINIEDEKDIDKDEMTKEVEVEVKQEQPEASSQSN